MTTRRSTRIALMAAAALLMGLLVFLFAKTQSADHNNYAEALARLRELRDLDARWDNDALRLADDLASAQPLAPDRGAIFARVLQELEQEPSRAAIGEKVLALRAGIGEKQAAFRRLREQHARSHAAYVAALESLESLFSQSAGRARTAGPASLLASIERVRLELAGAGIETQAALAGTLEPRLAAMVAAASAVDPLLAEGARRAEGATRAFLQARQEEAAAWRGFAYLPVGPRVELTARQLTATQAAALDDKDRWAAYLVAYAAALLVGVGYLALRVLRARRALQAANEQLEQRVAERTAELTRAMQQLKESEAQLVQTEKMSSLGQLVAGVAHEINTPLAYVKNGVCTVRDRMPELADAVAQSARLLAMLESESPPPEELQQVFGALSMRLRQLEEHQVIADLEALTHDGLHGIEQISELVRNLRNFSRLDRSKVASYDVNESVRATLLMAGPVLREVAVERHLAELPPVTCSPSQVNQVLLNLVTNAAQAMDKPAPRIVITTRREGDRSVAIEVADNGKGISPEHLPRIFDPFFTTKDVGSGTGLGLSIAYKIVAEHGGRIEVRSQPGEGATFTVTLPISPPGAAAAPAAALQEAA